MRLTGKGRRATGSGMLAISFAVEIFSTTGKRRGGSGGVGSGTSWRGLRGVVGCMRRLSDGGVVGRSLMERSSAHEAAA